MTQALEQRTYTPTTEYFDLELASDTRSEYRNGAIIPVTGGTPDHNELAMYSFHVEHHVKTSANQWLLSEYDDPNITLSLSTFDAQIEILALYENIEILKS
jgi:hypothetical protein